MNELILQELQKLLQEEQTKSLETLLAENPTYINDPRFKEFERKIALGFKLMTTLVGLNESINGWTFTTFDIGLKVGKAVAEREMLEKMVK